MQDLKIKEMSTEEYFFLTENLEFADADTIRDGVSYLLYNKKKKLIDTMDKVMQNELTDEERKLAFDVFGGEFSMGEILQRNHMTKSCVYRRIKTIRNKLEKSLKYVLIYESEISPQSVDEMMEYINEKRRTFN